MWRSLSVGLFFSLVPITSLVAGSSYDCSCWIKIDGKTISHGVHKTLVIPDEGHHYDGRKAKQICVTDDYLLSVAIYHKWGTLQESSLSLKVHRHLGTGEDRGWIEVGESSAGGLQDGIPARIVLIHRGTRPEGKDLDARMDCKK